VKDFLNESKFILLLFAVMTVATVVSYTDFESEKPVSSRSADEIVKATETKNPLALLMVDEKKPRTPAAVDSNRKETLKVEAFCSGGGKARFKKVPQSLVMLDMSLCETLKSERHIWVKNSTNGFKAQVFKTGNKNFRTDFIQLNSGNNRVIIESVLKDGQKRTQSLEILSGS
jgi:hypothetical protein